MDDQNDGEISVAGTEDEGSISENVDTLSVQSDVRRKLSFFDEYADAPNQTIYENLYEPKILSQWKEKHKPNRSKLGHLRKNRTIKDQTIIFNDTTAERFADVSHYGWKARVDYAIAEYEEEIARKNARKHEIQYDPNKLLNITIPTIILLASNKKLPTEYFMFTELYLKSIQNEYGVKPPNIRNFLKYMRYLKKSKTYNWGEMSHREPPHNLIVAKIYEEDMKESINRSLGIEKSKSISGFKNGIGGSIRNISKIPIPINKTSQRQMNGTQSIDVIKEPKNDDEKVYFTNTSPVTSIIFKGSENFNEKLSSTPESSQSKSTKKKKK